MLDEGTPLFLQIADQLSSDIVDGALAEGDRVPSTNEFAAFHRINPATAAKGINLLVDDGILEKRRGIGMFVVPGCQGSADRSCAARSLPGSISIRCSSRRLGWASTATR